MTKIRNKAIPQVNKNNKAIPENLKKKEYLESYDELKKYSKGVTTMMKHVHNSRNTHFRIITK